MGYESKIYVVSHSKFSNYGQIIAMFDLCKMGYGNGWRALFETPVDYDVFIDSHDEETTVDAYDETLKDAPIQRVIDWLENFIASGEDYRRLKPCLALLKAFDKSSWENENHSLRIIHYGY